MGRLFKTTLSLITLILWLTFLCSCDAADNGDLPVPGDVHEILIDIDPATWYEIRYTARNPEVLMPVCGAGPVASPFEYVSADVTVDGDTMENVGLRIKGWWGSINPTRPSMKIEFDEFVKGQRWKDVERLTLNNSNQDPTRMRTCLAYQMFQQIGYPGPWTAPMLMFS